ncbi:hypothetical protein [Rhodocyclus purpureus]|uniref:hypothetical protein n=1 Tax=Rhodocyclus purpureus TaxID=1067 RepID=UPI001911E281|nr:hypothetical protein [Rhodocyclus purpureus]MBK5915408.1 hypothetical protein [Rhodocyclus purpureus]
MQGIPSITLFGASVALGSFLGWQYLKRVKMSPTLVGLHLVAGAAGIETMVMLRGELPEGVAAGAGGIGNIAAILLVAAMLTGFLTPLIAQKRPRKVGSTALAVHFGAGLLGYLLLLAWLAGLPAPVL